MKRTNNPKGLPVVSLLNDWEHCLEPARSLKERIALGKKFRQKVTRKEHGKWVSAAHRVDPLELLASQDNTKLKKLLPLRYGRMLQSPFAFYRGAALIMASDLAYNPHTELFAQLCGDCHLSNFGLFATPERNVIFDLNDFDETLPGPFEWDVKRLAASIAVAADNNGFKRSVAERCVHSMARVYREKMEEFANMRPLDVWYHRVDVEFLANYIKSPGKKQSVISNIARLKEKRSQIGAVTKLTERIDGKRRIKDEPPLLYHSEEIEFEGVKTMLQEYARSLWQSRQRLLHRYRLVDVAAKIVGVGSVGNVAAIVLLQGEGCDDDHIILQVKEAGPSALEKYIGRSEFEHPGERIVNGQRMLQAASDLFLGWTSSYTGDQRKYYIRQLMDLKQSVPVEELDQVSLEQYSEVCAYVLARAHARTGFPAIIHGYLGKSEEFDDALTEFAIAYMKQNEKDHDALVKAVNQGKIKAAFSD